MAHLQWKNRWLLATVIVALICLLPFHAQALSLCKVSNVRHWSSEDYTRVVVDVSDNIKFESNRLQNPDRLYVDIHGSVAVPDACGTVDVANGLLRGIRTAQFDENTVRVVLDLGNMESYKIFTLEDPPRLVIDVFGKSIPRSAPVLSAKRVVLDPGHGGKDPGAIGPGSLKEKNIVLDIAKRVKRDLEKKGYEVILTRSTDRYLSLEERTVIANSKKADLFVSIHVNANKSKKVRGIETYLLNFTDNEEAIKVAARENKISYKRMKQRSSELSIILASLESQNKRDQSLDVAKSVQKSMVSMASKRYQRINNHGIRQAPFYVLFGARMPAVLVETSYITNYEEAKRLKSSSYRESLAKGIATGIEEYFDSNAPVQRVAQR